MRSDMILSYVRDLIEDMLGHRPVPTVDSELQVTNGSSVFFFRVDQPSDPLVKVWTIAACDLALTPELLCVLNEMNQKIQFARAFWINSQLFIESEIWGCDVNPANFQFACSNVQSVTNEYGPRVISELGGHAWIDSLAQTEDHRSELTVRDTSNDIETVGPYL